MATINNQHLNHDLRQSHSPDRDNQQLMQLDTPQESDSKDAAKGELPRMSKHQRIMLCILSFASLCGTLGFALIAPFFPGEVNYVDFDAARQGLTPTESGMIFSVYQLVMFFCSPFLGRYIDSFGSKFLFIGGLLITALSTIVFGLLTWLPAGPIFFWACFVARIIESVGGSAFVTAAFTITGFIEMFNGLGYCLGPPIGGIIYELGGYCMPFLVIGGLILFACGVGMATIPAHQKVASKDRVEHKGMFGLLKLPTVMLMGSAVFNCSMMWSYLDPVMQPRLEELFDYTPMQVGFMFLFGAGVYVVLSTFVGKFCDVYKNSGPILMAVGGYVAAIGMCFLAPAPFLHIRPREWMYACSLALMGCASALLYIPTFNTALKIAVYHGYKENLITYGCISGLFVSIWNIGGFIGPIAGGALVQMYGFAWTTTGVSAINFSIAAIMTTYVMYVHLFYKSSSEEKPNTEHIKPDETAETIDLIVNENEPRVQIIIN